MKLLRDKNWFSGGKGNRNKQTLLEVGETQ